MIDPTVFDPHSISMAAGAACAMMSCAECNDYVTKEECQLHRERFQEEVDCHEKRLNNQDVENAKVSTRMEIQTRVLWAIFGALIANLGLNVFLSH